MVSNIKIMPPTKISDSPFTFDTWYELEIIQVQFSLNHKIHEYKITDMNTFYMEGFEHSTSSMSFNGVITIDSGIPGLTLENKKDNFIDAASEWWTFGDQRIKSKCSKIYWRGWEQYMMIERLSIEKPAGDEEEYNYELSIIIHEGA